MPYCTAGGRGRIPQNPPSPANEGLGSTSFPFDRPLRGFHQSLNLGNRRNSPHLETICRHHASRCPLRRRPRHDFPRAFRRRIQPHLRRGLSPRTRVRSGTRRWTAHFPRGYRPGSHRNSPRQNSRPDLAAPGEPSRSGRAEQVDSRESSPSGRSIGLDNHRSPSQPRRHVVRRSRDRRPATAGRSPESPRRSSRESQSVQSSRAPAADCRPGRTGGRRAPHRPANPWHSPRREYQNVANRYRRRTESFRRARRAQVHARSHN